MNNSAKGQSFCDLFCLHKRNLGFTAPRVGLEPASPRLTAGCSTIELSRNDHQSIKKLIVIDGLQNKYICNSAESQATSEIFSVLTFLPFHSILTHKILFGKENIKTR
jgi:hypothetical protein